MSVRIVPTTKLRREFYGGLRGENTGASHLKCFDVINNPSDLITLFLEALADISLYDNREEPFFPKGSKRKPRTEGTGRITELIKSRVKVNIGDDYAFAYRERELCPLRTTKSIFQNGQRATSSGHGGIDYLALRERANIPILGEIKYASDRDPFYAFIQLLTYLSEISSEYQVARANEHIFEGRLTYPTKFDLHILLANFPAKGKRYQLIELTRRAVQMFKHTLADMKVSHPVGTVVCLQMHTEDPDWTLDVNWIE